MLRIKRPTPWASNSAARGKETERNPLPPASSTRAERAAITGSSGRGNGMRSIVTNVQVLPGTSIPCQSETVPSKLASGDSLNLRTNSATESPFRATISGRSLRPLNLTVKYSSARSTPRQEENNESVRPPAASIKSPSSSNASSAIPLDDGAGKCDGQYKIPCLL